MSPMLSMPRGVAMVAFAAVCAAKSPSFLQVQPQRNGMALDNQIFSDNVLDGQALPTHLLDLPSRLPPGMGDKIQAKDPNAFAWDLCNCEVSSNLGGQGPDFDAPQELRFKKISSYNGSVVDLVFTNTTEYKGHDVSRNTARGCFGVINLLHETNVTLNVTFMHEDSTVGMGWDAHYWFSVFDDDCNLDQCEKVEVHTGPTDVNDMCVDASSELKFHLEQNGAIVNESLVGTQHGTGRDNPPPLSRKQFDRAISFGVGGVDHVEIYLEAHGTFGRNFLFAGSTRICEMRAPPTTTPPPCPQGQCTIWGDPHIITFDASAKRLQQHPQREAFFRKRGWKSDQKSIYDEGTFWLVKGQKVHIQARYWHNITHPDFTNLGAVAIGGPFLGGNKLIIRSLEGASTWNEEEILAFLPSRFHNEYVTAHYNRHSEIVSTGVKGTAVDVQLPEGVSLTVNRWTHAIAVKINMCTQAGGQIGQCGNFDGDEADDIAESVDAQRVPEVEWLF